MPKLSEILSKARNAPSNLRFSELKWLLNQLRFKKRKGSGGSHEVYKHVELPIRLTIQTGKDGKAKAYQVRQLLTIMDQYNLGVGDSDE